MDNAKWQKIGNTVSITEYFTELENSKILYTLVFSSFTLIEYLLSVKGESSNIIYSFASVDESGEHHILYSGSIINEFNIAVQRDIIKVGNYITLQVSDHSGFYVSTIIVTDTREVFSEDWLWQLNENEDFILYQSNY